MNASYPSVEGLADLARQLTLADRARLIERVAVSLAAESETAPSPRRISYGALADLRLDVSEDDIADARREMLY